MPDFLLCNSKLTFQMTMTPEKTNYLTQGVDGVKRLKQGPDLSSYRGLSVIHSRAFAMEAGQHPRDILRRRVRTAEYYRILPNKENVNREFELYNEERDTWFSMSFHDLLRYALVPAAFFMPEKNDGDDRLSVGGGGYGVDNPTRVMQAYHACLSGSAGRNATSGSAGTGPVQMMSGMGLGSNPMQLGAVLNADEDKFVESESRFLHQNFSHPLTLLYGSTDGDDPSTFTEPGQDSKTGRSWATKFMAFDFGVKHIPPTLNLPIWRDWTSVIGSYIRDPFAENCACCLERLTPSMAENLFLSMQHIPLNNPFCGGEVARPQSVKWYMAYTFYQEVYKRFGLRMEAIPALHEFKIPSFIESDDPSVDNVRILKELDSSDVDIGKVCGEIGSMDISCQLLCMYGATGSVNNHFNFPSVFTDQSFKVSVEGKVSCMVARSFLLTYEVLEPLLRQYKDSSGKVFTGIDYIKGLNFKDLSSENQKSFTTAVRDTFKTEIMDGGVFGISKFLGNSLKQFLSVVFKDISKKDPLVEGVEYLCKHGVNTWPMGFTSTEYVYHPAFIDRVQCVDLFPLLEKTFGVLNLQFIDAFVDTPRTFPSSHPFSMPDFRAMAANAKLTAFNSSDLDWTDFWRVISDRIFNDPVRQNKFLNSDSDGRDPSFKNVGSLFHLPSIVSELKEYQAFRVKSQEKSAGGAAKKQAPTVTVSESKNMSNIVIDMNALFHETEMAAVAPVLKKDDILENVEIVIVRPNIEHNMLGIIMGMGGSELGHTLWGQTELSCYDDSMHGIWGMSYKYHQRAIVFNEKNLIRLWDIAYDGYNGGKDDTYVDWVREDDPRNGVKLFREQTVDLSKNYRGPSMMVMAFVHNRKAVDPGTGTPVFDTHFKRNWPSPIVFHEVHNSGRQAASANETLPLDSDNIQVVDVGDFRVFNSELYTHSYFHYREIMPSFHELHKMRKTAGQSSAEAETQTDSLAFQGSMRIKQDGRVIQEIQGSGHHGSDYVGVASIRAGKGIKYTGQAPVFSHMV
jgi:hypothetical protein